MNQKIYQVIGLVALLSFLSFGLVFAQQDELNDCCKIRTQFKINNIAYQAGDLVKSKEASAYCGLTADSGKSTHSLDEWGMVCLMNTINTATNWIFYIMTLLAVLMIVFGGFTYIAAAGDPTKAGKGKTILTFAIIGLAIALIAKMIPTLVRFILGM